MGSGVRLGGNGPWSLVELADALALSYDTVCRDVRRGILPAHPAPLHAGARYHVTLEDLARASRSVYRQAASELGPQVTADRTAG